MSQERKLVGPWRSIHGAVWLIGLAILFWKGWFWPGILVLIAISGVVEAVIRLNVPSSTEPVIEDKGPEEAKPVAEPQTPPAPVPAVEGTPAPIHRADLLPSVCPKCNAPIRGNEVKWTGPQSANCAYCGANLPAKSEG
jgi:hypothetical protein